MNFCVRANINYAPTVMVSPMRPRYGYLTTVNNLMAIANSLHYDKSLPSLHYLQHAIVCCVLYSLRKKLGCMCSYRGFRPAMHGYEITTIACVHLNVNKQ
ncbi:hypothetical protein J6590_057755 [Homalodisca vitripennis]|nr:hypothetical protein J6590_057755 [Homalodisca vitripennis]